jgi:hypothetical protein
MISEKINCEIDSLCSPANDYTESTSVGVHPQSDIAYSPKLITHLVLFVGIVFECGNVRLLLVDLYIILPISKD